MNKTEIENKIYDLKRIIKSCENIIKANKNEIKKLEAEKERPAFERVEEGKKYYTVTTDSDNGVFVKEYIAGYIRFDKLNFCLNLKDCTIHSVLIISLIGMMIRQLNGMWFLTMTKKYIHRTGLP